MSTPTTPNVRQLKAWLANLPPEFDDAEIGSFVHPNTSLGPFIAKRLIAWRDKESGTVGVAVNSMGTHYSDEWADGVEFVSILNT